MLQVWTCYLGQISNLSGWKNAPCLLQVCSISQLITWLRILPTRCDKCGDVLAGENFSLEGNKPLCQTCYETHFAPKCVRSVQFKKFKKFSSLIEFSNFEWSTFPRNNCNLIFNSFPTLSITGQLIQVFCCISNVCWCGHKGQHYKGRGQGYLILFYCTLGNIFYLFKDT